MKNMNEPLTFEYQDIAKETGFGYKAVALNAPLKYFAVHYKLVNGIPMKCYNEMMVKDCRNIDGCVYFCKGRVPEAKMNEWIELFQKLLKEKGWKKNEDAGFTIDQQIEIEEQ